MAGLGRSTRCLQEAAVGGVVLQPCLFIAGIGSQGSHTGMGGVLLPSGYDKHSHGIDGP